MYLTRRSKLVVILIIQLLSLAIPIGSSALTNPATTLLCGSSNQNLSTLEDNISKYIPSGRAYLKLNYQNNPLELSLYLNNYSNNQCNFIGRATANSNTWTYVGNISTPSKDIIIQGLNVGAAPYQAAVQLLIIPNNQCDPTTACSVKYAGLNGLLQLDDSNILSAATNQIAIYGLKPINGVGVKSVAYYSDAQGDLLYTSSKLNPINRNYLGGGVHNLQIQVQLDNGQTIYVNQTIDMGVDWTGTLYLKSLIYRNSGPAAVFIIVGIILILSLLILSLSRLIYKRRLQNELHGLNRYHEPLPQQSDDDNIITR